MPKSTDPKATAPAPEPAPLAQTDPKLEQVAEIIRGHLRDTELSRTDGAWNVLQSKLPAIAADILKEL